MAVGIDTSALYHYFVDHSALGEQERKKSAEIVGKIEKAYERSEIIIPTVVLVELANILDHRHGRETSLKVIRAILEEQKNRVVDAGEHLFADATILSKKLGVKYTDCVIYLIFKKAGALEIIAADAEFKKFGDLKIL